MASNVMRRSDGRLKRNQDAAMSARLMAAVASIPPFYETPFFNLGDVVLYDSQRDAGHIAGQGTIERRTYFNKFYYWIRIDGKLLDFPVEDLQSVPVVALSVHRLAWMRPPGYMGFDAVPDWIPPSFRQPELLQPQDKSLPLAA